MGAADVVPGVSGGTIAFISGIYERLLSAIRSFNLAALNVLIKQGIGPFWRHVDGAFLAVLLCGILLSIATFARLLSYLLAYHPLPVWGFFFGLIVASVIYIWRQISFRSVGCWLLLILGTGLVLAAALAPHVQVQPTLPIIFGAGMLAICAMILPGISGSFILLLLGMYPVILNAVAQTQWSVLVVFCGGCITGLLFFSRLLSWLLTCYHNLTLSILTGFLVGSLAVVWPWQSLHVVSSQLVETGAKAELLWPSDYGQMIGDPQWLSVIALMVFGAALVLVLEYIGGDGRDKL